MLFNVRYWPIADIPKVHRTCLLSGVRRTWVGALQMSAFDPKRTSLFVWVAPLPEYLCSQQEQGVRRSKQSLPCINGIADLASVAETMMHRRHIGMIR